MQENPLSGTTGPMTASREWRQKWPLVASAMAGLSFGAIPSATLGLFMDPLQQEFGWSRTEISSGMIIFALVSMPLVPFAGALVDKFGARRIAIPGLALSGLSFAGFSLMSGSIFQWFFIWVLYSLSALLIRSMVWNTAVAGAFKLSRGLAIALVLSGLAVAQAAAPIVANWLIDDFSWRGAYLAIGVGWAGIALILVVLFFRERPRSAGASGTDSDAGNTGHLPGGLNLKQAVRNVPMLRIGFAIFIQTLIGAGIAIHLVPLLTSSGITRMEAASIAALLGLASITGNLVTGWLVDRVRSQFLPLIVFALPALGYFILLQGNGSIQVLAIAMAIIGLGGGGALQIATYLTTQYAGMRHFGKIFGTISSLMGLAAGLGPLATGMIFDATNSYTNVLIIAVPAMLIAGIAVFKLGPYPDFETARTTD